MARFICVFAAVVCAMAPELMAGPQITTTTLTLSSSAVSSGAAVTLTARVAAGGNAVSPGLVSFIDGKTPLGSAQLTGAGTAAIKVRLGPGAHSITASFAGTATNRKSSSTAQALTVTGIAATATIVTYSGGDNDYSLMGGVTSYGPAAPTGMVSFLDKTDGNTLGTLSLGSAALAFQAQQITAGAGPAISGFATPPPSVAVGDFNADGLPDLAVANNQSATVSVFLNNGDNTFQAPLIYALSGDPTGIVVADFNSDGSPDLAITVDDSVSLLLGNGNGTFQAARTYSAGSGGFTSLAAGDFNHDGVPDLAVVNGGGYPSFAGTVTVLLGAGNGAFQPQESYPAGAFPDSVAVGDFNGDGIPDLAVANGLELGTVSVLLGNGDGSFQAPQPYAAGNYGISVAAGDFNSDGVPDLAVANFNDGTISVLLGSGNGMFQGQQTYTLGAIDSRVLQPFSIAVGDFNRDGVPDLVTVNGAGNVSVLLGSGGGAFQAAQTYPLIGEVQFVFTASLALGDFNVDGLPDIAVASAGNTSAGGSANAVNVLRSGIMASTATLANISIPDTKMQTVVASYSGDSGHQPSVSSAIGLTPTSIRSLSFSATSLAFGNEAGSRSNPQVVIVTNNGSDEVDEMSVTLDGLDPSKFAETTTCGPSLAKGASCAVSVTFTPTSAANYTALLDIHSDAAGAPAKIPISGTGLGVRSLTINPTGLNWAECGSDPGQSVTVTNNGSTGVYNMSVTVVGANASNFAVTSSTCSGSLLPLASCGISVKFTAGSAANYKAVLEVHSDVPGAPGEVPLWGVPPIEGCDGNGFGGVSPKR